MNLDRLRWGEWIAAIAAVNLLVVIFRAWYEVTGGDGRVTAWDALEQGRYLLIATALVGIFLFVIKAAEDTRQLSFEPGWIAAIVGFACTVYIAYRLATPPSDALEADLGIYLGLVSAVGVTVGGLLSAREHAAAPAVAEGRTAEPAFAGAGRGGEPTPALVPDSGPTWSPAAPAPSTTGWTPATPAVAVPPATAAGAALGGGERDLRAGDHVVLTAGGTRFPAGTVAQVVEVFGGGALVEVKASDGVADRFEVPEQAYERASAGAAAGTGRESWSPAMPAAADDDWGFDEPANGTPPEAAADEPKAEKVPWWKREIGGGKKKKGEEAVALGGAAAAGAAAAKLASSNGSSDEKPGFFKRMFGGAKPEEAENETLEAEAADAPDAETAPVADVAGVGEAAESDAAVTAPAAESTVDEAGAESAVDDAPSTASETAETAATSDPEVESATASAAAAAASDEAPSVGEDAASAGASDKPTAGSQPAAPAAEEALGASEPAAPAAEEALGASEPAAPAAEEALGASEPATGGSAEPASAAGESASSAAEPSSDAQPASEPAVSESDSPAPSEVGPGVGGAGVAAAGAGAAAAAAGASGGTSDSAEEAKPTRKRSSGNRKIPKEALAAAEPPPKVGDEVELKVGGGKFDAGTRGTVVDVFSAGVIVELSGNDGRTERLDLPFEAIGPASA